ncbi:signal recognition particle protein [Anaeromyxobacter dehalogenans 2CP-1]|uniref:Signal recognition particle protein n=1 Tax=Anaeromyxobacter dehalogenans (strain ATCC BAA-258 / DSM 21875 / 2CP-1) TaxID=455488 RepID=B8J5B8_ANAD2|nr:signal recognition particle protein [Anaeromyxobacter dehalogenans]ACL66780.1 signal recognition particle protein [Anaeromyxobacter dehalogenans 2CP-1]
MLETVSKGFKAARNKLKGRTEITPEVVDDALRDIRVSLLEADVSFDVVKRFVARVREKAIGEVVETKVKTEKGQLRVTPQDHFVKICHDELEALMGPVDTSLRQGERGRPTGIMMVGLQGSGKTTTAGKIANRLLKDGKQVMLVAADVYRPAAVDQLKVLGERLGVPVFHEPGVSPPDMCRHAFEAAQRDHRNAVIYDTAGRLAIDDELMTELENIKANVAPENILLVADAMIGQDAVKTATEFDRRLAIDGFILTKLDGDARGGAALSIKEVTGKPIKFLGMGEALDRLEEFRPEGLASRILGFGDIVGLVKDFEQHVDEETAEAEAQKILSGDFTLEDFVNQIRMVRKMGPLGELMEKFPMFGELPENFQFDDSALTRIVAMVDSMTQAERLRPDSITDQRVKRIAKGAGRTEKDVRDLLKQYNAMRGVMKQVGSAPGLLARLPGVKQLMQLRKMQGKGMEDVLGADADAVERAMQGGLVDPRMAAQMAGLPKGYTPPMSAGAMARARMMGYAPEPIALESAKEREARKKKRKAERQARKKGRKKGRR